MVISDPRRLDPRVYKAFKEAWDPEKYPVMEHFAVFETFRTAATQDAYYAVGRLPLAIVNAKHAAAGLHRRTEAENKTPITWTKHSRHQDGFAVDVVPKKNGKFSWVLDKRMIVLLSVVATCLLRYGFRRPIPKVDPFHFEWNSETFHPGYWR